MQTTFLISFCKWKGHRSGHRSALPSPSLRSLFGHPTFLHTSFTIDAKSIRASFNHLRNCFRSSAATKRRRKEDVCDFRLKVSSPPIREVRFESENAHSPGWQRKHPCLGSAGLGSNNLRLYRLLDFVREKINEKENNNLGVSLGVWRKREVFVVNCIIGHHLSHKEFGVCLSLMKDLLSRDSSDPLLISQLEYIQLQTGDLEGAKASFLKVECEGKSNGSSLSEVELKNLVNRNKALVYMVGKDYVSAVREYEECIERDNTDTVAINNKALYLMYLRDLSDSIKVLDSVLQT